MSLTNYLSENLNAITASVNLNESIEALSRWLDNKNANYSHVLDVFLSSMDLLNLDRDEEYTEQEIENIARSALTGAGVSPDLVVTTSSGYQTLLYLMTRYLAAVDDDIKGRIDSSWQSEQYTLYRPNGEYGVVCTIADFIDSWKNDVCNFAIENAVMHCLQLENVTDRLSVFKEKISESIVNTSTAINNTINYWSNFLSDIRSSVSTRLQSFVHLTGLDEQDPSADYSNTISALYTGKTSRFAYNFNIDWTNVGQAASFILAGTFPVVTIARVLSILKGTAQKILHYIGDKINSFFNPSFVKKNDAVETSYSVDGFHYHTQLHIQLSDLNITPLRALSNNDNVIYDYIINSLPAVNDVYSFKLFCGELVLRVNEIHIDSQQLSDTYVIWDCEFKPYIISESGYVTVCKAVAASHYPWGNVNTTLNVDFSNDTEADEIFNDTWLLNLSAIIAAFGDNLYQGLDNSSTGDDNIYYGSIFGTSLFCVLGGIINRQMNFSANEASTRSKLYVQDTNNVSWCVSPNKIVVIGQTDDKNIAEDVYRNAPTPNNLNLIKASCGYNEYQSQTYFDTPIWLSCVNSNDTQQHTNSEILVGCLEGTFISFVSMLMCQKTTQDNMFTDAGNPRSAVGNSFIPYLKNVDTFTRGCFTVVSDAERDAIFSKNVLIAILITTATTVAVVSTIGINKMLKNIRISRIAEQGRMDNAMWNGQTLTASQTRRYFKLLRKNGVADDIGSGLISDSYSAIQSIIPDGTNQNLTASIYLLISGQSAL